MRFFIKVALTLTSAWALSGCCGPSECPQAVNTFAKLEPVTNALLAYQAKHGQPPENLFELNAGYLPQGIRIIQHRQGPTIYFVEDAIGGRQAFSYNKINPNEYYVGFAYAGPGTNSCGWTTSSKTWICSGGL